MDFKTGECCPGDVNPFRRPPLCATCADTGWSTRTRFARRHDDPTKSDVGRCPSCGTEAKRNSLLISRPRTTPRLRVVELTEAERKLFDEWREQGHHELDCLRWIEAARYDPAKDPVFLSACAKALRVAAFRAGRDESPAADDLDRRMQPGGDPAKE